MVTFLNTFPVMRSIHAISIFYEKQRLSLVRYFFLADVSIRLYFFHSLSLVVCTPATKHNALPPICAWVSANGIIFKIDELRQAYDCRLFCMMSCRKTFFVQIVQSIVRTRLSSCRKNSATFEFIKIAFTSFPTLIFIPFIVISQEYLSRHVRSISHGFLSMINDARWNSAVGHTVSTLGEDHINWK